MANIFDLFKQIAADKPASNLPLTHMVVGLGNPGPKYARTRHNAGFLAIDHLAEGLGVRIDRSKYNALVGEAELEGTRVLLMKPQTLMNRSGEAVGAAASFYKIAPENIIVLSDDISLEPGRLRVRRKGSHGGHNGLRDIEARLGSSEYQRIKIGVGQKPHPDYDLADWVLSEFSAEEMKALADSFPTVVAGIRKMVQGDTDGAMQICNKK